MKQSNPLKKSEDDLEKAQDRVMKQLVSKEIISKIQDRIEREDAQVMRTLKQMIEQSDAKKKQQMMEQSELKKKTPKPEK